MRTHVCSCPAASVLSGRLLHVHARLSCAVLLPARRPLVEPLLTVNCGHLAASGVQTRDGLEMSIIINVWQPAQAELEAFEEERGQLQRGSSAAARRAYRGKDGAVAPDSAVNRLVNERQRLQNACLPVDEDGYALLS